MDEVLLFMGIPMIAVHAAMAALGFRGRSVARGIGIPVAAYEILYYAAALSTVSPPPALAIPLYAFAVVHFAGGAAYIAGRPRVPRGISARADLLVYYAAYELVELAFLAILSAYILGLRCLVRRAIGGGPRGLMARDLSSGGGVHAIRCA